MAVTTRTHVVTHVLVFIADEVISSTVFCVWFFFNTTFLTTLSGKFIHRSLEITLIFLVNHQGSSIKLAWNRNKFLNASSKIATKTKTKKNKKAQTIVVDIVQLANHEAIANEAKL